MCRDAWPRVLCLSGVLLLWCRCRAFPMAPHPPAEGDFLDHNEVQAELDNIKERILANLGLSRVPDVSQANVSEAEMSRMMEIYRRSVAESEEADEEEEREDDDRAYHRFYSYRDTAPLNRTSGWQHLFFPLRISNGNGNSTYFSSHSAKLRLHRLCHGKRATASLYQLLEPWDGSGSTDRLLVEERKLTPKKVNRTSSWQVIDNVFDLSRPVSTWLESPTLNYGLLLRCSSTGHPRRHPYTSSRAVLDIMVKERPNRQKRSPFPPDIDGGHNIRRACTASNKTNVCCRYSLTVNFKAIDWDFVIQPKDFEANFCRGRCPYDLSKVSFSSNHAIIQSIINKNTKTVPKPCCVPKKFKSLSIMHLNDKDPPDVVVTRYKGMAVKTCTCS